MSLGPAIKTTYNGRPIRLYMPSFRTNQMAELGNVGIASMLKRIAAGLGSNDQQMPPYSDRKGRPIYARYSMKHHKWVYYGPEAPSYKELQAKAGHHMRVLRGPGLGWTGSKKKGTFRHRKTENHMLDQIRVTSASPTEARIAITTEDARVKARANEKRAPWFGFSGRDVRSLTAAAKKMWGNNILGLNARIAGGGGAKPKWLDPLGMSGQQTIAGKMADAVVMFRRTT